MSNKICKICGDGTVCLPDPQFQIDYYLCRNCQFISMTEEKIISPKDERQRYLQHVNTADDSGYVKMLNEFLDNTVTPFQPAEGKALDFGCGPGPVLASILNERGYDTDVYDLYFKPEKIYQNKSYTLITCTEVVEHLKNPIPTLQLLNELLEPGGLLAIMTLFHPVTGSDREDEFRRWWYRRDSTHISFYRPETFRVIANRLNLQVLMTDRKNRLTLCKTG